MIKKLLTLTLLALSLFFLLSKAIEKHEQAECLRWKENSKQYINYYFTDWQIEQCKHYNLPLNN